MHIDILFFFCHKSTNICSSVNYDLQQTFMDNDMHQGSGCFEKDVFPEFVNVRCYKRVNELYTDIIETKYISLWN